MSAFILAAASAIAQELESLDANPEFRRATYNMKLAYGAASKALGALPESVSRDQVALVVGTSFGELGATYDFMAGLALEKTARPLAFQNSLHHSTLGFLSRVFKLMGPGYTVSRGFFTGEDAVDLGQELVGGTVDYALVVGVDHAIVELRDVMELRLGRRMGCASGAGALLLSGQDSPGALAEILGIEYCSRENAYVAEESPIDFYDSNAVSRIGRAARAGKKISPLSLVKPDGSSSNITFRVAPDV